MLEIPGSAENSVGGVVQDFAGSENLCGLLKIRLENDMIMKNLGKGEWRMKRLICLCLVAVMLWTMLTIPVFADETAPVETDMAEVSEQVLPVPMTSGLPEGMGDNTISESGPNHPAMDYFGNVVGSPNEIWDGVTVVGILGNYNPADTWDRYTFTVSEVSHVRIYAAARYGEEDISSPFELELKQSSTTIATDTTSSASGDSSYPHLYTLDEWLEPGTYVLHVTGIYAAKNKCLLYLSAEVCTHENANMVFGKGKTTIDASAFRYCDSLADLTIPANVVCIEDTFKDSGLESIYFLGSPPAFEGCFEGLRYATAYYPANDPSWTEAVRDSAGGYVITWIACDHDLNADACGGLGSCLSCGAVWYAHNYADATCTLPQMCACGAVKGDALGHDYHNGICKTCGCYHPGDVDQNGKINMDDAVYLFWHSLFPEVYPLKASADLNGDGAATTADTVILLWHCLFPTVHPLQ